MVLLLEEVSEEFIARVEEMIDVNEVEDEEVADPEGLVAELFARMVESDSVIVEGPVWFPL